VKSEAAGSALAPAVEAISAAEAAAIGAAVVDRDAIKHPDKEGSYAI
jgi:hypothetical protein